MRPAVFYWHYTLRHLNNERQRSVFVLFCIAAGVAAVIALNNLGFMIGAALQQDLQAENKGDLAISMPASINVDTLATVLDERQGTIDPRLFEMNGSQSITLSRLGQQRLRNWAHEQGAELQPMWSSSGPFTGIHKAGASTYEEYVMVMAVEPASYPFFGKVELLQPAGSSLAEALSSPRRLAISARLAEDARLNIGDTVLLSGAAGSFQISAIVSEGSEGGLTNLLSTVFPFVYLSYEDGVKAFHTGPTHYYIRLPSGSNSEIAKEALLTAFPGLSVSSVADLARSNRQFSDIFGRLITVSGIISLLIGGIGIANTMLVSITRRAAEIAVLKTIGVQARQIFYIFLLEACLLGFTGSLLGAALGLPLLWLLQRVSARFISATLPFALYPQAIGLGLGLGMLTTLAFSLLPILSSTRLRPIQVLRPSEATLPPVGKLPSLLVLLALGAALGTAAGAILGSPLVGIPVAYGLLVVIGLAALLLRGVIWLLCRLPSFGLPALRLAQRNLDAQRARGASTLLALVSGVFSLGLIWAFVQGSIQLVSTSLDDYLGGNILVTVQSLEAGRLLERRLARLPGVSYIHEAVYPAEIIAINGDRDMQQLLAGARQVVAAENLLGNTDETLRSFIEEFTVKTYDPNTWDYQLARGEHFSGKSENELLLEIGLEGEDVMRWLGLEPGDTLTLRFPGGAQRSAVIRGINRLPNAGVIATGLIDLRGSNSLAPDGFVPLNVERLPSPYVLQVAPEQIAMVQAVLAETPGVYFVETRQMSVFTERIAEQFAPLPVLIGGLALFAACTIIANSVSLAVIERRRQIATLKALGLHSERVVGLLLLENGLLGLLGGILGVLLSAGVLGASGALGDGSANLPGEVFWILSLLAVVVTLAATLLSAINAARQKPLDVLRYE